MNNKLTNIKKKVTIPKIAVIKFILNEKDMEKYIKVKTKMPDKIYKTSEIEKIGTHKVVDSSSRFGFYILALENLEEIGWVFNNSYHNKGYAQKQQKLC